MYFNHSSQNERWPIPRSQKSEFENRVAFFSSTVVFRKKTLKHISSIWSGIFPNCASLLNFLTCLCSSILEGTSASGCWVLMGSRVKNSHQLYSTSYVGQFPQDIGDIKLHWKERSRRRNCQCQCPNLVFDKKNCLYFVFFSSLLTKEGQTETGGRSRPILSVSPLCHCLCLFSCPR